jgi:hypothetical protein
VLRAETADSVTSQTHYPTVICQSVRHAYDGVGLWPKDACTHANTRVRTQTRVYARRTCDARDLSFAFGAAKF